MSLPFKDAINTALQGRYLEAFDAIELKRVGKDYKSLCPFHQEKTPSFSVNSENGHWKCFGCGKSGDVYTYIMEKMGLDFLGALRFLAEKFGVSAPPARTRQRIVAKYDYMDEHWTLLFQAVRYEPKRFTQRRPDGNGDWIYDLRGVTPVLYRLPEVIAAVSAGETVYVVEGEKDADRLRVLGLTATCNPMGAKKWQSGEGKYNPPLSGAKVVVIADNDVPGREHAEQVAASLSGTASSVKVRHLPDLPEKGDVSDWLDAGGTLDELLRIVDDTPLWTPASPVHDEPVAEKPVVLRAASYPSLHPAALYGLAGDFVRAIAPHTEADPVALLIQFLVAFGSVIGRCAHFVAEADAHYSNLYAVLIGQSSKARKGTSWGYIKRLFQRVDPDWVGFKIQSGLSSGEGLIWAVRDPVEKDYVDDNGEMQTKTTSEGVEDKRLLVQESEFASVLKVAGREGNTLSAILRSFWDSGTAQTMTKKDPARATGAHISIVGHITRDELRRELSSTESGNGFGNRFMWFFVRRSKELPEGGNLDENTLSSLVYRLKKIIEFASDATLLKRDDQARQLWCQVYHDLSEGKPGLAGALTSRAEAQVMRLATLYALLDASSDIRMEHLTAALALWEYSEESTRYIFGESLGDPVADRIWDQLREEGAGMNRTQIRDLFLKNQTSERIEQALALLVECGRVECRMIRGKGRPAETWFAVTPPTLSA